MMSTLVPETGRARSRDRLRHPEAGAGVERARRLSASRPTRRAWRSRGPTAPCPTPPDLSGVPTIAGALQGGQTEGIWLSGGKLYHVVAAPVLEGGSRLVGVIAAALPDQRRGRAQPRAAPQHAGRLPRRRREARRAREGGARRVDDGPARRRRARGDRRAQRSRPGGPAAGQDDRPARPRDLGRHLSRLRPADPLLHRPARRRRGRAAQPRPRARRLPPDPEHAGPGRASPRSSSRSSCPSSSRGGSRARSGGWSRATEQVRVGNLDAADLPVESKDEIGILARSFRAMLEELARRRRSSSTSRRCNLEPGCRGRDGRRERRRRPPPARAASRGSGQVFAARYEIQGSPRPGRHGRRLPGARPRPRRRASRSRPCAARRSPRTRRCSTGSSRRSASPAGSRTRTSSARTTSARRAACATSRWSSSRASR